MKYAVLDWDNTVRRGFTLFDWMDYLFDENIIDRKVNREIEEVQLKYAEKAISHDDYARKACMIYARAMNGVSALLRDQLVQNYIDRDIKQLQPFSRGIFSFLNKHGIRPIIISGAPEYVLKQYKDEFKLFKIYALLKE